MEWTNGLDRSVSRREMHASAKIFHDSKSAFCIVKRHDARHHSGFSF